MQEKAGLYQVEAADELSMILHVINTAEEKRLLFIVDSQGRTFHNQANLRIIKEYALDRERELAVVTDSPLLEDLCRELGIPCFATVEEARGEKVFPVKRKSKLGILLKAGAAVLVLAVVLTLFFAQNQAVLVAKPAVRIWQGELELVLDPQIGESAEKELTVTASISPQGRKTVGVEPAKGSVSFFNNSNENIKVPKNTVVVAANGQRYLVEKEIVVPKQERKFVMTVPVGVSAGQAKAPVVATDKGTSGNAEVGKLTKLEGSLAGKLQVINTSPISGGKDQTIPVVTRDDLNNLEKTLLAAAQAKVQEGLADEEGLFFPDAELEQLNYSPQGNVGQSLEKLEGTMKVKARGRLINREKIAELVAQMLQKTHKNWQLEKDLRWEIAEIKPQAGKYSLKVKCQGTLVGKLQPAVLTEKIAGRTKAQAEELLGSLPELESFQLSTGREKLPKWRTLIKVVVESR